MATHRIVRKRFKESEYRSPEELSQEIAGLTREFLDRGGVITVIPSGNTGIIKLAKPSHGYVTNALFPRFQGETSA